MNIKMKDRARIGDVVSECKRTPGGKESTKQRNKPYITPHARAHICYTVQTPTHTHIRGALVVTCLRAGWSGGGGSCMRTGPEDISKSHTTLPTYPCEG